MALKVFSCCSYSTLFETRTREEWNALQFVRAIKGRPLRGYARVPLPDGTRAYLDQTTAASAPGWFAQMAAQRITWDRAGELALTPIPDAACDIASGAPPKTRVLAVALAAALPPHKAAVFDVLRWRERMVPAHVGVGTRDPQELYGNLRLTMAEWPADVPQIVLVDDVMATGAHFRAAAAFLRDWGGHLLVAICAGRADNSGALPGDPFRTRTDILKDFQADPDWTPPMTLQG